MSHQHTIYLIDEDAESRRSVALQLGTLGVDAWSFVSCDDFISHLSRLRPGCILLATEAVQGPPQDMIGRLRASDVEWPVIMFTGADELAIAVDAMKQGAVDFLQKPIDDQELRTALTLAEAALDRLIPVVETKRLARNRIATLTPREADIATALLRGRPNKVVAYQLGISVRTVEAHRAHIMMKLGVRSLAEVLLLMTRAGAPPLVSEASSRTAGPIFGRSRAAAPHRSQVVVAEPARQNA